MKNFFHIDSKVPFIKLKYFLDLTIDHYIEAWSEYKNLPFAPIHGDLSLVGNVMFNKDNEVLIVDWEQFDDSMKIPTGLDIIIMLMENIYYEELKFKKIKKSTKKHFINSVYNLNHAKLLSPLLFHNTTSKALDFINSHLGIWKGQHFKLPALKLSKNTIYEMDNKISSIL